MRIQQPWNTSHIPCNSELEQLLFPVESTNNTKVKITRHRIIGHGSIQEGILLMNALLSQCSIKF